MVIKAVYIPFYASFQELLRIWYVAVTSLFVVYYCNLIALVVILLVPSALLVAARRGGALICWFISVIFLVSLSSFQTFLVCKFLAANIS